jgi:four helix bundle protein
VELKDSSIPKGYGRKTTQEYIQALYIAYGSNCELETQILSSGDLKNLQRDIGAIETMLKALIKSLENKHLNP